jgi:hypothetical protein
MGARLINTSATITITANLSLLWLVIKSILTNKDISVTHVFTDDEIIISEVRDANTRYSVLH